MRSSPASILAWLDRELLFSKVNSRSGPPQHHCDKVSTKILRNMAEHIISINKAVFFPQLFNQIELNRGLLEYLLPNDEVSCINTKSKVGI